MVAQVRTAAVARLAAALVAVALTGAPRVVASHAPVEGHRCTCKPHAGGHHECDCAICKKAALAAEAADENAPPCHRAAAQKALKETAPSRSRSAPCVEGTCGGGGRFTATPAGVEPFCLPAPRTTVVAARREPRREPLEHVGDRALEPETPPPRAG